jgi:hypothetical protein
MAATVTRSPAGLVLGPPKVLFATRVNRWTATSNGVYAMASDGQSFLILEPLDATTPSPSSSW